MAEKVVLLDGYSLAFRAFYGMPPTMTNADGIHTNAIYGFLLILRKIIEEEQPDLMAVAFDTKKPTFRHEQYPDYKGNRTAAPPEFHEQVPLLKEALRAMGIPCLSMDGYEADDLLGTLARRFEAEGLLPVIVSGDRDLLQLASEKIRIVLPKTKGGQTSYEQYYAKDVEARIGVSPRAFIDMKALMGDSSDNIPGLPGVGEKTALQIIQTYGSIEEAHAHLDEIKPPRAQTAMREHYDLATLSKTLATIDTDVPINVDPEEMRSTDYYNPHAFAVYRKLGFKSMYHLFDEESRAAQTDAKTLPPIRDVESPAEFLAIFEKSEDDSGLSSCVLENEELAICLACEDASYFAKLDADSLPALRDIVQSKTHLPLTDAKGFQKALESDLSAHLFDSLIAAYLLNPLQSEWSFEDLAAFCPPVQWKEKTDLLGKQTVASAMSDTTTVDAAKTVMMQDAQFARMSRATLLDKLQETKMLSLFLETEMPLTAVLASMEQIGILADKDALCAYGEDLQTHIEALEKQIYADAGEEFNINSPKQLGVILFEKLGLPGGKKTKTGFSTAADVLEKLAETHPIAANVLSYRTYSKLKSTYADGLQQFIGADGRIRTTFHQTITATGRLSSTDPNLQNIPMREELGRKIRKCFYPAEGCVFIDADYSQIELRVLAHMSGDEKLIEAYQEARDIHRATAAEVFHVPFEEVTEEQRRNAKAVNFGIVYGISSFGLSQGLSITPKQAQTYIAQYFETYPKIKSFLDGLVEDAKTKGYAVSLYGRRRPMNFGGANFVQRSFLERAAMNSPIQGTAADIIKMAMNRVYRRLRDEGLRSKLILQIHDELLIEAPIEEAEQVRILLVEEMEHAAQLKVKLVADCHEGSDWYEAK